MRKSENINVASLRYDSNVALASILYNLGESAGLEAVFQHFSCHFGKLAQRKIGAGFKSNQKKKSCLASCQTKTSAQKASISVEVPINFEK